MNAGRNENAAVRRTPVAGWLFVLCAVFAACWSSRAQQSLSVGPGLQSGAGRDIWVRGVGEGFRRGAQSLTLSAGGAYGLTAFGSQESHDLALGSVTYGVILDNTVGRGHWYGGNFELRAELFGGVQFSPRGEWLVGLTPHLRYDFATGSRWVPYLDVGAGISGTSIRGPDLGGPFQFNLGAAVGLERFVADNVAVTLQAGYFHMSSAGIYEPNTGVNCVTGMVGVGFFF